MFEAQYNDQMRDQVLRLEAMARAVAAGHPEWPNACAVCGKRLEGHEQERCDGCA